MTRNDPGGAPTRLSVPPKFAAPRQLTGAEVGTLRVIADVLIPAAGDNPPATTEPDLDAWLRRAAMPAPMPSTRSPRSSPSLTGPHRTSPTRPSESCTPTSL
jgi:hypothetical protein